MGAEYRKYVDHFFFIINFIKYNVRKLLYPKRPDIFISFLKTWLSIILLISKSTVY